MQTAAAAAAGVAIKLCRRCNLQKPVSEFYRSKANADGYDGRCKVQHHPSMVPWVCLDTHLMWAVHVLPRVVEIILYSSSGTCSSTCVSLHALMLCGVVWYGLEFHPTFVSLQACDAVQCAERRRKKPRVEVRPITCSPPLTV